MNNKSKIFALLLFMLLIYLSQGCKEPGWVSQASGTSLALYGVWFVDANAGTVVGNEGLIRQTTNGGDTWNDQASGTGNMLIGVCFTDNLHGWVVGKQTILHTNDGGATWVPQISEAPVDLESVFCLDENTAWIVGGDFEDNSIILHTSTGGRTWIHQRTGIKTQLMDIFFTDSDTGTAVGGWCVNCVGSPLYGGYILRTTNGGATWHLQLHDTTLFGFYGVAFSDANTGTVVGASGTVLRTTDGGASWIRQTSGTTTDLRDVCFINADTGIVVGGEAISPYQGGIVIRTTNGGLTWTEQEIPVQNILLRVCFTDSKTGTAVGYRTILKTNSGGEAVPKKNRNNSDRRF